MTPQIAAWITTILTGFAMILLSVIAFFLKDFLRRTEIRFGEHWDRITEVDVHASTRHDVVIEKINDLRVMIAEAGAK